MPVRWEEMESAIEQNDGAPLYFLPDRALDRLRGIGDLFAPVLTLQQELPDAFESTAVRRMIGSRDAPVSHRCGKLLHMPASSSQGGRRLFSLVDRGRGGGAELRLHLPSRETRWKL